VMAFVSVYNDFRLGKQFGAYLNYFIIMLSALGIIPYILKKLQAQNEFFPRFLTSDLIILFILFPIVAFSVYGTGGHSGAKILFLIPVIIAATAYGKAVGLTSAFFAILILFSYDVSHLEKAAVSKMFQLDLIFSGVMITLAWLMGGFTDIEKRTREQLLFMANTDALTGLASYHRFQERLREELAKAKKNSNSLALIMMDLDYFKFYSDNYGHQRGNELLAKVGEILQEVVQEPFFPARYGGEEFIIVMPGVTREFAREKALEIEKAIESFPFAGVEIQPLGKMTVSMGVGCYPEDGATPEELIQAADDDLYRSKYGGSRDHLRISITEQLRALSFFDKGVLGSLKNFLTAVNVKDRYTFGHSERVMAYAVAVADRLRLPEDDVNQLRFGAYLHDVGKIEVDTDILIKEGPLTDEEWAVMRRHPVRGGELVRPLASLAGIVSAIRHHHENYNGTGYPDGLRGEEIPLLARVLRVVDSFDAMTTVRPYKEAKTPAEACFELRRLAGIIYDPVVVEIFTGMILEQEEQQAAACVS
ncbi:MAG: diguanylate cyclase, partial [Bacillota bacterium]